MASPSLPKTTNRIDWTLGDSTVTRRSSVDASKYVQILPGFNNDGRYYRIILWRTDDDNGRRPEREDTRVTLLDALALGEQWIP